MSHGPLVDVVVNIGCVVIGFVVGGRAHWGKYQPNNRFFIAVVTFTTFALWFITGAGLHVDFWLLGNDLPYNKTVRFAYLSVAPLACAIYLLITKQAAAPLENGEPCEPENRSGQP